MDRLTKEIELFGHKVILAERNAFDVLELIDFVKKNEASDTMLFMSYAIMCQDALKLNLKEKGLFKNHWNKQFSHEYLLKHLSTGQLVDLVNQVMQLEGFETNNKKKVAKLSEEKLQGV